MGFFGSNRNYPIYLNWPFSQSFRDRLFSLANKEILWLKGGVWVFPDLEPKRQTMMANKQILTRIRNNEAISYFAPQFQKELKLLLRSKLLYFFIP